MTTKVWPDKDPNERKDYGVDWSDELAQDADAISSSVWVISGPDNALISVAESNATTDTTIRLSGGTNYRRYDLTNTITTIAGQIMEQVVTLRILSKQGT